MDGFWYDPTQDCLTDLAEANPSKRPRIFQVKLESEDEGDYETDADIYRNQKARCTTFVMLCHNFFYHCRNCAFTESKFCWQFHRNGSIGFFTGFCRFRYDVGG